MEKLKQISVKIDQATLAEIDQLAVKSRYWKRNAIINGVLTAIFDCCDDDEIMTMARYWRHNPNSKPRIIVTKNQG